MKKGRIGFIALIFSLFFFESSFDQQTTTTELTAGRRVVSDSLNQPLLVDRFYTLNHQNLFWFRGNGQSLILRQKLTMQPLLSARTFYWAGISAAGSTQMKYLRPTGIIQRLTIGQYCRLAFG